MDSLKIVYKAVMEFEEIVGGIPESKDVVKDWLAANGIQDDDDLAERIAAETIPPEELEKELSKITTTFKNTPEGQPAIESRCVKAAIKQAAGVMGLYSVVPGLKELVKEGSEVKPRLIPIARDRTNVETDTKLVHTTGPTGPVNGIGRYRFVRNVHIEFEIHVTDRASIAAHYGKVKTEGTEGKKRGKRNDLSDEMLGDILKYIGEFTGLGANRSQGFGKGKLISLTRV